MLPLPQPVDPEDAARVAHQRLRRRLLYGSWTDELRVRMRTNLGIVRADAIGEPDMSANPFEVACSEAAALYDRMPTLEHPDEASLSAMRGWTADALLYPMMARLQRDTIGMREMLLRVHVTLQGGTPKVRYYPVFPDLVTLTPDPSDPSRPSSVREYVRRPAPDGAGDIWTQDLWSVAGPYGIHMVLDSSGKTDLSEHYGLPKGGLAGDEYPMVRQDGRPVLPYALYHAAVTGTLMDPYYRQELVQGTLNVGVLWTFFVHCVRAASWPQRWIAGGSVAGAAPSEGIRRVVADPATILEILQDPTFEGQVTAGQWGSASDPMAVAEAIGLYERRFTAYVGVGSEFWKTAADPRSGVALTLDRAGRIEAQRRYSPLFAPIDAEVLSLTATAVNAVLGAPAVAEDGWVVRHQQLQPSMQERVADREETLALLDAGLISPAEARARVLGEDLATAAAALPTPAGG